ncbi:hypothetical protein KIN_05650 [Litoreibacter roseus]|uniref:Uncharacterized protein n=1 Tax=Litoreibacter roseus TaxID=2601869 RepID=A0A6N6JB76_9RHOB|nr:hypothetical protein KIN_05650 [Litoreibacter roseus]
MDLAPKPDAEPDGICCIADPDLLLKSSGQVNQPDGAAEHEIDGVTEGRFIGLCHGSDPEVKDTKNMLRRRQAIRHDSVSVVMATVAKVLRFQKKLRWLLKN